MGLKCEGRRTGEKGESKKEKIFVRQGRLKGKRSFYWFVFIVKEGSILPRYLPCLETIGLRERDIRENSSERKRNYN